MPNVIDSKMGAVMDICADRRMLFAANRFSLQQIKKKK